MPVTDTTPPTTAPPADPVRAALGDPAIYARVLNQVRASYRGNPSHHDDIAQTACSRAIGKCASYDAARGSVVGWICGFVPYVCWEQSRKDRRQPFDRSDFDLAEVAARPSPEDTVADRRRVLERCLETLSRDDRDVLEMAHIKEWEHERIATHYGISNAAARQRVSRAMTRAKQVVKSLEGEAQS